MSAETAVVPDPAATGPCSGVLVPYAVVVPYSKCHVVACWFGLTVPWSVAEVWVMLFAFPVVTVGTAASALAVIKSDAAKAAINVRMASETRHQAHGCAIGRATAIRSRASRLRRR